MAHLPTDPRAILSHLLSAITAPESRHFDRYGEFSRRNEGDLEQLLYSFLRPELIRLFQTRRVNPRTLQALQPNTEYPKTGVYYHSIFGRDRHHRAYIGQSTDMPTRIKKQHMYFRWRRDHPSLHCHALEDSSYDTYIIIAVIPNPQAYTASDLSLLLNLLEMWCCLLFQTLPKGLLREYLPGETAVAARDFEHLNVALPLDQGDTGVYHDVEELANSHDRLVRSYYQRCRSSVPPAQHDVPDTIASLPNWNRGVLAGGLVLAIAMSLLLQRRTLRPSRYETPFGRGLGSLGNYLFQRFWPLRP
ncbi:hypothetical protein EJ05DRAFT_496500 [Pseudovirgaria hyperparasitica]|uniref:GIY-YIG domain-containing protein n=1 Tax=Pseudovirgaria hyperparasitica TaxID=470096 RepID=A0A6A6WHN6_9PEZI|nr:uncharacterized protein EJ05DRAFT_496500 [Pseudovirgaria hyperparasitica]KAF2761594.1 hypothetical protein EJ05DRAFT_496500 [Pseudovirgaria hyperparasitica]